jgi:glucokinase
MSESVLTIGVDIGGTKVLGGVVDSKGNILATHRAATPKSGGAELTATVIEVINILKQAHNVAAVGISAAGFVSSNREVMLATPNIAGWNGVNLHDEISAAVNLPVVLENDANAAAWGEAVFGAGEGAKQVMILTIGTGLGGGLVVDGQLHRGAFGIAAEFGHMRVVPGGDQCGCGARGCFEQYASGSALVKHAKKLIDEDKVAGAGMLALADGRIEDLIGAHITSAAQAGDKLAIRAFEITGEWLGAGIATLSVVLDPEVVVIGGGVVEAGELLMAPTRAAIERYMPFAGKHPYPKLVAAALGNDAGLVGAADLARH